jgi:hypothetical protein
VKVRDTRFLESRQEVEESPSYKGLFTMYHLYAYEVECEGLPVADFASLDFRPSLKAGKLDANHKVLKYAHGWRWVSWPQVLDIVHARTQILERSKAYSQACWEAQRKGLDDSVCQLAGLTGAMQKLCQKVPETDVDARESARYAIALHRSLLDLQAAYNAGNKDTGSSDSKMLPPSMVSKMAENTIASEKFLEEAQMERLQEAKAKENLEAATRNLQELSITRDMSLKMPSPVASQAAPLPRGAEVARPASKDGCCFAFVRR